MRNIETFPSKQMYPYLSLDERKVAEFYHNIDRMRWLVWLKWLIFITFLAIDGVLRMFFNEDQDLISSADGECISVFDSFNVFDNTKVHDIMKVE